MNRLYLITKFLGYSICLLLLIYGLFLLTNQLLGLALGVTLVLSSIKYYLIKKSTKSKAERIGLLCLVTTVILSSAIFSSFNFYLHHTLTPDLPARAKNQIYTKTVFYDNQFFFKRIDFLKTLSVKSSKEAVVYFSPEDEHFAAAAINHIRKVINENEKLIDAHQPVPVTVILYRDPENFQKQLPVHSYENLHGMYVPTEETVHLLLTETMEEDDLPFLELIAHEYTHHWIVSYLGQRGLVNGHLPRWFEEGIAEYAGLRSIDKTPEFFPLHFIPFKRIESVSDWANENRRISPHLPYRQSYYAIDQLVRDGNQSKIKKLLMENHQNFYHTFETVLDESMIEFELRFLIDEMKEHRENTNW
ncbi:collagenase [Fictibacillus phosphorivorans]|uniref:collagenase n=1 Tax=Fictibacillus phosphorivorans TaxID=1221500 RepID=UPI00203BA863|nr:collagenase [Fictibacillus phosphorivorans]MCM3718616.1 collagenase [Fictibacillus phosphorivorans]MCM3776239.1 collagenase [Fictibacillus phosphorivorans]